MLRTLFHTLSGFASRGANGIAPLTDFLMESNCDQAVKRLKPS